MPRPRYVVVAVLAAAAIATGTAAAEGVIVERSEIRFVATQLGAAVEGRFRKWTADVAFLPQDLAHSKVVVDVDLGSIDLASDDTERELRGAAWFDTAKFPVAHFASTSIADRGDNRYEIAGELSIKGFARRVVVPVVLRTEAGGNRIAEGSFGLKRLDFKVGEGQWADTTVVANDVTVRIRMVLSPPK
ncbi:MAG: YceI family protein [Burkholderiales bacterium]